MREIEKSRFVRSAVEKEVLRCAAGYCDEIGAAKLDAELEKQVHTMAVGDFDSFGGGQRVQNVVHHHTTRDQFRLGYAFIRLMPIRCHITRSDDDCA